MSETLTLQIVRSDGDYHAFRCQSLNESEIRPFYRGFNWACAVFAFLVSAALTAGSIRFEPRSLGVWQFFLLFFAFFGVWWFMLWLLSPLIEHWFYPSLRIFKSPTKVELNERGIEAVNEFSSQFLAWPAISDVVETEAHVFIRVDGASAITVPKHAFGANSSVPQFVKAIRDRLVSTSIRST